MKMAFTLAYRLLKQNKKRTLAIVLAASLVAAMVTAVWFVVWEGGRILREVSHQESGKYHVFLTGVEEDKCDYINNYRTVENTSFEKEIGYASFSKLQDKTKPYVFLRSVESEDIGGSIYVLNDGEWPKNSREIVLPLHLKEQSTTNLAVGDKITLSVGQRVDKSSKEVLTQEDPIALEEGGNGSTLKKEEIIHAKKMTFTITGFMKRPSYSMEGSSAPGFTAITTGLKEGPYFKGSGDVSITYYNSSQVLQSTSNILSSLGYPEKIQKEFSNKEGLHTNNWEGIINGKNVSVYVNEEIEGSNIYSGYGEYRSITKLAIFLTIILIIFSCSAVYYTFSVCMQAQVKEFSLLRSMGATLRQIKNIVLCEGVLLGALVAIIGVIAGFTGVYITLLFAGPYINDILPGLVEVRFGVSLQTVLVGMGFAFISMVAAVYIHTIKLKKDTVLLASFFNRQYKKYAWSPGLGNSLGKLFGFEAGLAFKNLMRNKKVYISTLSSLVVSTVLIFCFSFSMNQLGLLQSENKLSDYDLVAAVQPAAMEKLNYNNMRKSESTADRQKIEEIEEQEVKTNKISYDFKHYISFMNYYYNQLSLSENIESVVGVYGKFTFEQAEDLVYQNEETAESLQGKVNAPVTIHIISDEMYQHIVGDQREYLDASYGVLAVNADEKDSVTRQVQYNELYVDIGGEAKLLLIENHYISQNYRLDLSPYEINVFTTASGLYRLMGDQINQLDPYEMENRFYIETFRHTKALEDIEQIIGTNEQGELAMEDNVEWKNERYAQKVVIYTFSLGLVGLVLLISLTNVYNTIHVSLSGRKREFAVLKSVGLENKSMRKILIFECIYYAIQTIVISLILLFGLNYFLRDRLGIFSDGVFSLASLSFWLMVVMFLILYMAMRYFARTLFKDDFLNDLKQIH